MFSSSAYRPETRPLGYINGYPMYLTTILVVAHVVTMLLAAVFEFNWWEKTFAFSLSPIFDAVSGTVREAPRWEVWRWITWPFVDKLNLWWIINLYFFLRFGRDIERIFGRVVVGLIYGALTLGPAIVLVTASCLFPGLSTGLAGSSIIHFCFFLAFCFVYPGVAPFRSAPQITIKLIGSVLFGLNVLQFLTARDFTGLTLFVASCGLTYAILRNAGLAPRFGRFAEAFSDALPKSGPKLKVLPPASGPGTGRPAGGSGKYYEPKIKPKPDIAPERNAVEEINTLLDKVAATGLDSLTPDERAALERASARLREQS